MTTIHEMKYGGTHPLQALTGQVCMTAGRFAERGFPTIKLFLPGNNGMQTIDHQGGRAAQDIIEWVSDQLKAEALSRVGLKGKGNRGSQSEGARSDL